MTRDPRVFAITRPDPARGDPQHPYNSANIFLTLLLSNIGQKSSLFIFQKLLL